MLTKKMLVLAVISIMLLTLMTIGCTTDPEEPCVGADCPEVLTCADLNESANVLLASLMDEMINTTIEDADSSFRPRDIDFTEVHSLYEQALANDPSCNDAKFGSAFTSLMIFLADENFNILIDRFKETYDSLAFNPLQVTRIIPEINFGSNVLPEGIPLTASGFTSLLPAPLKLDRVIMSAAGDDPVVSDIQDIFNSSLLPNIQAAQEKLVDLIAVAGYTFEITPAMQGNIGALPIIIDGSDMRVMLAGLYSLESAIHIFLARNLDVTAYSASGIESAVNQSSQFLSLRPGGAAHMASAKNSTLSAETQLENAVTSLIAEINTDQTNHLIKVYPEDSMDLVEIKDSLIYYRTYFDGPKELKIVWTNWEYVGYDPYWGYPIYAYVSDSLLIDVDIRRFFDAPLNNPKNYIPNYAISITELNDLYKTYADANFSSSQYWHYLDSLFQITHPHDTSFFDIHLPDNSTSDEFYDALYQNNYYYYYNNQTIFGWDDVYYRYCYNPTDLYCYSSDLMRNYNRYYESPDQLGVCFSWQANDFAGWTWPDPTFNGLLPTFTNDELKDLLIENPERWDKGDCDTLELNF